MTIYDVLQSIHFLVKCRILPGIQPQRFFKADILPTVITPPLWVKSLICAGFSMFNLVLHTLIILRIYVFEKKLDFVSFAIKLKGRPKFFGQRDFPAQNSYTGSGSGSMSESQFMKSSVQRIGWQAPSCWFSFVHTAKTPDSIGSSTVNRYFKMRSA